MKSTTIGVTRSKEEAQSHEKSDKSIVMMAAFVPEKISEILGILRMSPKSESQCATLTNLLIGVGRLSQSLQLSQQYPELKDDAFISFIEDGGSIDSEEDWSINRKAIEACWCHIYRLPKQLFQDDLGVLA